MPKVEVQFKSGRTIQIEVEASKLQQAVKGGQPYFIIAEYYVNGAEVEYIRMLRG